MNSPHLLSQSYEPHHESHPTIHSHSIQCALMLVEFHGLYLLRGVSDVLLKDYMVLIKPADYACEVGNCLIFGEDLCAASPPSLADSSLVLIYIYEILGDKALLSNFLLFMA